MAKKKTEEAVEQAQPVDAPVEAETAPAQEEEAKPARKAKEAFEPALISTKKKFSLFLVSENGYQIRDDYGRNISDVMESRDEAERLLQNLGR